jgi:hypothetical protein
MFPEYLFNGYKKIRNCKLVKDGDTSEDSLAEFQSLLNSCQPEEKDKERFLTVKDIYFANRKKYQKFISGTAMECTILWTESKVIVNWFGLSGKIFLTYDFSAQCYNALLHRNFNSKPNYKIDLNLNDFPNLTSRNRYTIPDEQDSEHESVEPRCYPVHPDRHQRFAFQEQLHGQYSRNTRNQRIHEIQRGSTFRNECPIDPLAYTDCDSDDEEIKIQ